jgi:hypothetical protein
MTRKYTVNAINYDNEIKFSLEAKNKREVKNIIKAFNGTQIYTVVKNNKLVKRMSSKKALEIIKNF